MATLEQIEARLRQERQDPDLHYHHGLLLAEKGDAGRACRSWRRAIELDPKHFRARHLLGTAYLSLDRFQEAYDCYRQAIEYAPDEPDLLNALAVLEVRQGRTDEARSLWQRALELKQSAQLYYNLGTTYLRDGLYQEAESALSRAVDLDPDDVYARNALGQAQAKLGRNEDAENTFRKALDLAPNDHFALNNLGKLAERSGRSEEALQRFEAALRQVPDDLYARNNLGRIYAMQGEHERAEQTFLEVLQRNRQDPIALHNLGRLAAQLERWDEAIARFRAALEIVPSDSYTLNNLGRALLALDRHSEAEEAFERSLSLAPDDPFALNNLAICLIDREQYQGAAQTLESVLENHPEDLLALNNLGYTRLQQGENEAAESAFLRVVEVCPDDPYALANLGLSLYRQGRFEESVQRFRAALELDPNDAESLSHLAHCLLQLGDGPAALELLDDPPGDHDTLELANQRGLVLLALERWEEAIATFRSVLDDDSEHQSARNNLAISLARAGEHTQAQAEWSELLRLHPNSTEAHFNLGMSAYDRKNWNEAREHFEEALAQDSSLHAVRFQLARVAAQQGRKKAAMAYLDQLESTEQLAQAVDLVAWRQEVEELFREEEVDRTPGADPAEGPKDEPSTDQSESAADPPGETAAETADENPVVKAGRKGKRGRKRKRLVLKGTRKSSS